MEYYTAMKRSKLLTYPVMRANHRYKEAPTMYASVHVRFKDRQCKQIKE